jgi:hypothetical protein
MEAVASVVHDRMPVILDADGYDLWLDPGMRDVAVASELLKPYDARLMRCFPVSTRINSVANEARGTCPDAESSVLVDRSVGLCDTAKRLTDCSYPLRWVVCRAIEISLAEGAVAASQESHDGNRMESFPKISNKLASL